VFTRLINPHCQSFRAQVRFAFQSIKPAIKISHLAKLYWLG